MDEGRKEREIQKHAGPWIWGSGTSRCSADGSDQRPVLFSCPGLPRHVFKRVFGSPLRFSELFRIFFAGVRKDVPVFLAVRVHLVAGSRVLLMEDGDQRESVVAKRKEILEFIGKEKRKRECAATMKTHANLVIFIETRESYLVRG